MAIAIVVLVVVLGSPVWVALAKLLFAGARIIIPFEGWGESGLPYD